MYSAGQWASFGHTNPYLAWDIPHVANQLPAGLPASALIGKMGTALHLSHLCKSTGRGNIAGKSVLKGRTTETSGHIVDAVSLFTECSGLGMTILPIARAQLAFDATFLAINNSLQATTIPEGDAESESISCSEQIGINSDKAHFPLQSIQDAGG